MYIFVIPFAAQFVMSYFIGKLLYFCSPEKYITNVLPSWTNYTATSMYGCHYYRFNLFAWVNKKEHHTN